MPEFHPDFGDFVQEDVHDNDEPLTREASMKRQGREALFEIVRAIPEPFQRKLAAKAAVMKIRQELGDG